MKFAMSLCLSLLLAGCQSPPQTSPINFSVPDIAVSERKIDAELKSITVSLARPDEKKGNVPMGTEIIPRFWESSMREATERMAIFSDESKRKVSLQVKILAIDVPRFGYALTTKTIARYELFDRATGAVTFTQEFSADGHVPAGYAHDALTRSRESLNRSVQNNISQFLHALRTLNLPKPPPPVGTK